MNQLPCTLEALVVRTDFSADGAWDALRASLFSPSKDGFLANVAVVDDRMYGGLTSDQALDLIPAAYQHPLLVLLFLTKAVDHVTVGVFARWSDCGETSVAAVDRVG